ncbi:Fc.00g110460.m01.CDS01 [Cosmosporella sp. VM-42]
MLYHFGPGDVSDGDSHASLEGTETSGLYTPVNGSLHGSTDFADIRSEDTLSEGMSAFSETPFEVAEEPEAVREDSSDSEVAIVGHADESILETDPLEETEGEGESEYEKDEDATNQVVPGAGQQAKQWLMDNPGKAACFGAGAAMCLGPGLIAAPILGGLGFGAGGIVGGSIAAALQSSMGSVAAGGLFATLQSAGAGGYGAATVYGAIQAGGIGLAAAGAASSQRKKKKREEEEKRGEGQDDSKGEKVK